MDRCSTFARARPAVSAGFALAVLLALAGCNQVTPSSGPAPAVTIVPVAGSGPISAGGPLRFLVRADPAPAAALKVAVMIASPGCALTQRESVTIPAGDTEATLTVATDGATVGPEGCSVTATIAAGDGYTVGAATAASASTTLTLPVVTITADSEPVTEGSPVSFMLTATPAPAVALPVTVSWSEEGMFLAASRDEETVTIPTSGTVPLTADTADDGADEPDGSVTVTVKADSGYTVGRPDEAIVAVTDNDTTGTTTPGPTTPGPTTPGPSPGPSLPEVHLALIPGADTTVDEGDEAQFRLTADPAPASALPVNLRWGRHAEHFIAGSLQKTVTIAANSATGDFAQEIEDDEYDEGEWVLDVNRSSIVDVTIEPGSGYRVGSDRIRVEFRARNDDAYRLTLVADSAEVDEDEEITFTLAADPAPPYDVTVMLEWSKAFGSPPLEETPPETFDFSAGSTTATLTVVADGNNEPDYRDIFGTVAVKIKSGTGYTGNTSGFTGEVTINDDD